MDRNPAHVLLRPSTTTTATTSSPPPSSHTRFLSTSSFPSQPCPTPPAELSSVQPLQNMHPIFSKFASPIRGSVRIRVEKTTFYCHREILSLASPFFESVIEGNWKETAPPERSRSRALSPLGLASKRESYQTAVSDPTSMDDEFDGLSIQPDVAEEELSKTPVPPDPNLEALPESDVGSILAPSVTASYISSVVEEDEDDEDDEDLDDETIICRLRLKEERASSFHDMLCHIYPRLECLITWQNVQELCQMASKFDIPSLRNACIAFLLPSAAGKPIMGMKIAEDCNIPELYKEASRYTLDNYQNWPQEELAMLSEPTLLKLERRRSWFLERLLKLGLVQTSRDYVCQAACPDPLLCARLVDEKWRSAWSSAFRFGTPQPSIIYRSLRNLEPSLSSSALHLPHTACQSHARLYVADLFDRMFGQTIQPARSWTALTLNGTSSAGGYGRTFPQTEGIAKTSARYFLFIEMEGHGKGRV